MTSHKTEFGILLRDWRVKRGFSQMELSHEAGLSTKHLSFLENGRSNPSRETILKLQRVLSLSRSNVNHMLQSAGFKPEYISLTSEQGILKPAYTAIDNILSSHMPSPAVVFDQHWNFVKTNPSCKNILDGIGLGGANNLIEAIQSDSFNRAHFRNFEDLMIAIMQRVRNDSINTPDSSKPAAYDQKLFDEDRPHYTEGDEIIFRLQIDIDDTHLELYLLIVELGYVNNISGSMKVVLGFPANNAAKVYFSTL